jgi:membrane fusion protein, macrolide-specific efflux system
MFLNIRRSVLVVALTCSLLIFGGYLAFSSTRSADDDSSRQPTGIVTQGSVEEVVLALGTLEPASMVRVGAQVTGQVKAIHVRVGQAVEPGDLLAEIDAVPQQNELKIAQAKVADTKAQRDAKRIEIQYAEAAFKRQHSLSARDVVSQTALEEAEAKYKTLSAELASLDAQIEQSEVDLQTAQANLAYTRITAPMKGRIVAVPVQQGQTLNSAQTSPTIAVIANLDEMLVKIRISEADVARTKPGQRAWFTTIGEPQTRYDGPLETIEYAPPSIANEPPREVPSEPAKDSAIYYDGVLRVKNPEGKLRTKMTAQVRISVGRADNVLLVPWAALSVRQKDGSYLVKVRSGTGSFVDRPIRIGLTDKINAQLVGGLREGDVVLLNISSPRPRGQT